jgi:HEAT repeat protein
MHESLESHISDLDNEDAQKRHSAAHALRSFKDSRARDALAAAMVKWRDESGDMAALSLRRAGGKQCAKILMEAMCDERLWLRERALHALTPRHGDTTYQQDFEPMGRAFLEAFENATDDCLREGLANAFSQWRIYEWGKLAPLKVQPLLVALDDPNPIVREKIAGSLGRILIKHWTVLIITEEERKQLVSRLALSLQDEFSRVRAAAAYALGRAKLVNPIPALTASLGDVSGEVRSGSAWALGLLQATESTQELIAALDDREADVRRTAVYALRRLKSREAVPSLIERLNDIDSEVRREAVRALGKIRDSKAISALIQTLDTDEARFAAYALRRFDDEEARDAAQDWLDRHP